eukprot:g1951.t1
MNTVMITGCSSGFGLETARYFLEKGWSVVATMRVPDPAQLPVSERLRIVPLDISNQDSIAEAVAAAGPVDALVNNAGVGWLAPFEGTSQDNLRRIFETNTFGTLAMTRALLPQMRAKRGGVIVNVSSSVTLKPLPLASVYTASKAAVNAFTECLALELAPFGIRTHLVLPGQAPTTSFGKNAMALMAEAKDTPADYQTYVSQIMEAFKDPSGKVFTDTEDVVAAIWNAVNDPDSPLRIPAGNGRLMVKTPEELELMRVSGRLLASAFEMLDSQDLLGMSTLEVNDLVERFITIDLASRPASKGQYGFDYVLNSSINAVVCHGVPSATDILCDGDIVNFDITLEKNGFLADSSKTYVVGNASAAAKRLVRIAEQAMWQGIKAVRPGAYLGDVGFAIERHAKKNGCSVVREYCGHGIGREMHEAPNVLNFGRRGSGIRLKQGMVFTIEPMINNGTGKTVTAEDEWTVLTKDRKLSAQFEHTVAVVDGGAEVLTLRQSEQAAARQHLR